MMRATHWRTRVLPLLRIHFPSSAERLNLGALLDELSEQPYAVTLGGGHP